MVSEPRPDEMPYARDIVTAWMVHLGYTAEDIHLDSPDHKAFGCELNYDYGWQCDNNDEEKSRHPLHDAAEEAFQPIMFALEHLSAAGALMPAGGETSEEEWAVTYLAGSVQAIWARCETREEADKLAEVARRENDETGRWPNALVEHRTVTTYPDGHPLEGVHHGVWRAVDG